ncbi:MAG: MFS transporter [Marmoricola sp.]
MLRRLGFPDLGRHRRFVTALGIDAVGSGVWTPISLLYFLSQTDLSLVRVGLALSIGSLAAVPLVPMVGQVVDALGPKRVIQTGNLVEAAAFALYPFAHSLLAVIGVVVLSSIGRSLFYGAYGPFVTAITRPGERETWFGFLHAMRNAGFGIGGLLAGLAVTIGTSAAYDAVVLANAASYLLSFALMQAVPLPEHAAPAARMRGAWSTVLRDRGYRWLVTNNFGYAMAGLTLNIVMPVYFVRLLGLPGWLTGAAYVINTVMIGLGQGVVVGAMTGVVRTRVIAIAVGFTALGFAGMWAASGVPGPIAVALVLVAAVVFTLGEMTAGPVLGALAAESAPVALRGRYMAAVQLSWTASSALAPLLYATMLDGGAAVTWGGLLVLVGLWGATCVPLRRLLPLAALPVTNLAEIDRVEAT